MELLTTNVMDTTGLDPATAKAAIGHVLLFLRGEAPLGHVTEFIDRVPGAREAVDAAAARDDGGVTAAIEGMTSFMGRGRAETNILAGKLLNLGLDETQIKELMNQILGRAEGVVGTEGAAKIRALLPASTNASIARTMPRTRRKSETTKPRREQIIAVHDAANLAATRGSWNLLA